MKKVQCNDLKVIYNEIYNDFNKNSEKIKFYALIQCFKMNSYGTIIIRFLQ